MLRDERVVSVLSGRYRLEVKGLSFVGRVAV